MMRLLTVLSVFVVLASFCAPAAQAQDWEVEGELHIEDLGDPGTESNTNSLQNQPKIEGYVPFLEILSGQSNIGFGTVDYRKDSDPFGEFVLTITATSVGPLDVTYILSHEIIDVSTGTSFMMKSDLTVELIDMGDSGVTLTATGAMLAPGVTEEDGLGTTDVPLPTLFLAVDEVLNGEGSTSYSSEPRNYIRNNTTVEMFIGGSFQLSTGDKAILRGRFEIARDLVPVEDTTWGQIKALYDE